MSSRDHSFESLCLRVVEGEVSVETVAGVPAWPACGRASAGSLFLFVHRDHPGAVALVAFLGNRPRLAGCFSDAVRSFLAERCSSEFNFELAHDPERSLRCVLDLAASAALGGGPLDGGFFLVPGVDGAELLHELLVIAANRAVLH